MTISEYRPQASVFLKASLMVLNEASIESNSYLLGHCPLLTWDEIRKSVTTKRALEYQEIQVLDPILLQAA